MAINGYQWLSMGYVDQFYCTTKLPLDDARDSFSRELDSFITAIHIIIMYG